jgi:hypothetical protein
MCRFPLDGFAKTQRSCWPTTLQRDDSLPNPGAEDDVRVRIAADHAGFALKEKLVALLRAAGHELVDFGTPTELSGMGGAHEHCSGRSPCCRR